VLRHDGATIGTVGGGKLEAAILSDARVALAKRQSLLKHYALKEGGEDAVGTLCGGELTVFIQSYMPPPTLVIVGGGHIGRPLKTMAEAAGVCGPADVVPTTVRGWNVRESALPN